MLARFTKQDRRIAGYRFEPPSPRLFHPYTSFPIVLPRRDDLFLSVYDGSGTRIYADTMAAVAPGAYTRPFGRFGWNARDEHGRAVPGGFYLYRAEAGLVCRTHAMRVSRLRKLVPGEHRVFSAVYGIGDLPASDHIPTEQLPYRERGVFGVTDAGRLSILYTEGYTEKALVRGAEATLARREAWYRWMSNVVVTAVGEDDAGNQRR